MKLTKHEAEKWLSTVSGCKVIIKSVEIFKEKNPTFTLLKTLEIKVPKDWKNSIDDFKKNHEKDFYYFNSKITDANFKNTKLEAGRTYQVKIWQINKDVSSQEILDFLEKNNAIFTSAQGLAMLWQEKRNELPKSKWYISMDKKENLPSLDGGTLVPFIFCYSDGDFEFSLDRFEDDWYDDRCVIGFCDLDA